MARVIKYNLFSKEEKEKLYKQFAELPLQAGDILFRTSNAKFYGIPFSKVINLLTKSNFSHASMLHIENDEYFLVEIDENGVQKMTIEEWVNACTRKHLLVYRLKDIPDNFHENVTLEIIQFLEDDPLYDFTFNTPDKFYCTESIIHIYEQVGIEVAEGYLVKEILPFWVYYPFAVINWFVGICTGATIPLDIKGYFVGNEKRGIMASDKLEKILEYL